MVQRATESIVVNAPADVVYGVVTDFANYLRWASDLKMIQVIERDSEGRALEVEFRAAAFGRSTTYSLRYDYSRAPEVVAWHQTAGDLTETMNGQYRFDGDGDTTTVTYDLEVELLVPIPAFIKSRAAHRIQTQALYELKTRAEQLR